MAVGVTGRLDDAAVVHRGRVELRHPDLPKQPFHAAEGLPLDVGEKLVAEAEAGSRAAATSAIAGLTSALGPDHRVVAAGLAAKLRAPLGDLASILGSHPRLHMAEGDLYRQVLAGAAEAAGLPVTITAPDRLVAVAAATLGCEEQDIVDLIGRLGRGLGPPWRADEKNATMAALIALHGR